MKPEMNMMDLTRNCRGPLRTSPGPKAGVAVDAYNAKTENAQAQEGAAHLGVNNKRTEKPAFKKIIKAVVAANQKAVASNNGRPSPRLQKPGEAAISTEPGDRVDGPSLIVDDNLTMEEKILVCGFASGFSQCSEIEPEAGVETGDTVVGPQASEIVRKAIKSISQTLNLKIDPGLANLRIDHPIPAVKELLAEMLAALKGIVGLLEDAVNGNQTVDIGSKLLDPSQAAFAEKTLRTEIFNIELALSTVEVGSDVAARIAQQNNKPSDSGIIKAMDPSGIAMPASQIKQVVDANLFTGEQRIETLFSKLAQIVREQVFPRNQAVATAVAETHGFAQEPGGAGVGVQAVQDGKKTPEVGEFDSPVMRMLLKIDKIEAGNKEAALQNEKLDLPKMVGALFAKKPGDMTGMQNDKTDAVLKGVFVGKDPTGGSGFIDPLKSSALPKAVEASVMNQLSTKVQTAVKTGVTEIRLLLRPESLGEMRVKLTIDGDVVMGKIYVENQQVKHIIETNMQSLKDSLAQHNLQTGSFDVNVGGQTREQLGHLAHRVFIDGEKNAEASSDAPEPGDAPDVKTVGIETGRRFGSNTIEYFA
jgi:hypothetical protein